MSQNVVRQVKRRRSKISTLFTLIMVISLLAGGFAPVVPQAAEAAYPEAPSDAPRNVIIMISDGMGYNQMDAASYYQHGETGQQVYEQFPVKLAMTTYSADGQGYDPAEAESNLDYVRAGYTDSASAATAMATGFKTYDSAIGVDVNGNPLMSIFEYAELQGKMTGVVSSVEFSHATPAAFVAHNISRNDYASIANEMIYDSNVDVIMGAGNPDFDNDGNAASSNTKYAGGDDTWADLMDDNEVTGADADGDGDEDVWTFIDEYSEFEALINDDTPPARVIGVPQVYQTLQFNRSGDPMTEAAYDTAFIDDIPTLKEMTQGALNVLDEDPDGLYLMVEGGAVDWAGHGNASGRLIEEQIDFNNSVEAVVEWVEDSSNGSSWDDTLVIVTADHETGYLLGPGSCDSTDPSAAPTDFNDLVNNGAGNMPGMQWCNKNDPAGGYYYANHTNTLVPFFAKGKGAEVFNDYADQTDPVRGDYINNTEIAEAILEWVKPEEEAPKNVIILISDGWGYNHIAATNAYTGQTPVYQDGSWFTSGMSSYQAEGGYDPAMAWSMFDYVKSGYTDSAAAGTAMSTGIKTYAGAIGVDMNGNPVRHLFEDAEASGKKSGVVSSVEFSHATPASFVAHNVSRNNYAEIANEMIYDSATDVIMGAGNPDYDNDGQPSTDSSSKYAGGDDTWADLTDDNQVTGADADGDGDADVWSFIDEKQEFLDLMTDPNPPERVIGVPQVYQTLQYNRGSGGGYAGPDEPLPYTTDLIDTVPTLEQMSKGALNVLDNDPDGFFLMVEGGAVDWAGHGNATARMIEEQIDFNNTVEAVTEWVETHSSWEETLVIVTGDHETGYLTGPDSGPGDPPVWNEVTDNGAGEMPGVEWHSGSHTNSIIPFFAKGKGSRIFEYYADEVDPVRGRYIDNIEMAQAIRGFMLPEPEIPDNVIILIGDGMGYNHVDAASYYQHGEIGKQTYEQFPYQLGMSTYEHDGGYNPDLAWSMFDYVKEDYTDSAAAATAMSTGHKTYGGAIGVTGSPESAVSVKHMFEYAEEMGKRSGVVSSVEFSHATPAGFVAHNASRNNYEDIANEMIYSSTVDLIMGAGHPHYDNSGVYSTTGKYKYIGGEETWNDLTDADGALGADGDGDGMQDAWTFIDAKVDFQALITDTNPPARVIGVPQVYQTLQMSRGGAEGYEAATGYEDPFEVPLNDNVPSLKEMSQGALNVLSHDNPEGFYLMIEGGAIDWASHANMTGRMIEEMVDFNDTVDAVVEWVEDTSNGSSWEDTLVIVTADHETGYLLGPDSSQDACPTCQQPIVNTAKTVPDVEWYSGSHTNSLIPFYAKGKGAAYFEHYADEVDPVRGRYIDNTEIAKIIFEWAQQVQSHYGWRNSAYNSLPDTGAIKLSHLGSYVTQQPGEVAEIAAYDPTSKKLFATNSEDSLVEILDLSDPTAPTAAGTMNIATDVNGGSPNSVAVANGVVAVAVENDDKQQAGFVALYDTDGTLQNTVTVGALPDMLTFTPDGTKILVANEGEPNDDYTDDPLGSVSIVDISGGVASATVTTVDFTAFNAGNALHYLVARDVRVFGPNATVAQDLEPEYITVSDDGEQAWVVLQENNAVAIMDTTVPTFTQIVALGFKDHSKVGNALDASNKDDAINITNWPVLGMYQPDAIGSFTFDGETYLVTANEGDARDYDGFSEEVRVKDLTLDASIFGDVGDLQENENLGRLRVTTSTLAFGVSQPDTDGNGEIDALYSYGARSFSIWNASGKQVFDSGDDFEWLIAAMMPESFNIDEDEFDGRSDDKGPEPEGLVLGEVDGRTYAFIGLERQSGVMVYDVTHPKSPAFIQYVSTADDIAPEGLVFISADDSPNGQPFLVVTYEDSGSTAIFEITYTASTPTVKLSSDSQTVTATDGTVSFDVELSATSSQTVTVDYTTLDMSAMAGMDYEAACGRLTFAPGETSKTITINLMNNAHDEVKFNLVLSNPVNAILDDPFVARVTLAGDAFDLRILHTNDTHAQLEPESVWGVGDLGGITRRKTLVDHARMESSKRNETLLLLDAGDVFQGTLYFNMYEGLADLWFYNALGYDAMAIGNHEFDKGPSTLAQFINGGEITSTTTPQQVAPATFPLLSANADVSAEPLLKDKVSAYTIVEEDGEKIGVFGLTTPETDILSSPGDNVTFSDAVATAKDMVKELADQDVNKIIALTHQGIKGDKALAEQVPEIDIIVGGHSHTQLYGDGEGYDGPYPIEIANTNGTTRTLIVSSWEKGKYLGDLHVLFDDQGTLIEWGGQPHVVDKTIKPDDDFEAKLAEFAEPLDVLRNTRIGESSVLLDGERSNVRSKETNLANLITDAMVERVSEADCFMAIQNGGGIRASIPAGDVTVGQVRTVLPYGNRIATVDLTGAQIKEALENGVSQVEDGAGRFPQVAGMKYVWNPDATAQDQDAGVAGQRIVSLQVDGDGDGTYEDIDPTATYCVATNNYMLEGGDGYSVFAEGENAYDTGYLLAEAVEDYIGKHSPVNPQIEGRILEGDGTQAQEATVVFSQQNYTVGESGGSATISVTLDMALSEEATVDYATSDDTAEAGSDYTAASGTLTIPAGKTTATFDVSITDDAAVEDDETLKLTLSNPVNVTLGTTKTATLKIMDDEQKVVFAQGNITVKEDVGSVPVTVTLKPASNQMVSVDYATSNGTATAGNDYTATSGTVTFQPGETSQSFNVAVLNDTEMERAETVKLALSNPVNVVLGTAHTATLTIQDDDSFHLRVLHTNDTHAQLEPTNVFGVGDLGGIAQRKTLVDQARTESAADGESVLLLDAGDVFQGTLYFNQYEGLADLWFYNHLQYDAMAVGNHEFDNGPETLAQFINGGSIDADGYAIDGEQVGPAVFPLLSANTDVSNEPLLAGKVKPWVIVERQDEKIGILGLTAQDTAILSSPGDNVTFSDPVAAAEQAVAELEAEGVNKIIALTHIGFSKDKELAAQVNGIDVIVIGHSHTQLYGDGTDAEGPYPTKVTNPAGDDVLIVSSWQKGQYLGNIHLMFDADGEVVSFDGQPYVVDENVESDPTFAAKLQEFGEPIEALNKKVVGETTVLLDGERGNVRSKETNLGNLITDAMLERTQEANAQIAIQNGGGIRASIPAGDVTVGQVRTVLPFGNRIATVDLTGAQVKEALENGVSQVEEGAGRFPQVAGIQYTWTPSATVGSRILSVKVADGSGAFVDIDPEATYRVATNNYLLEGGDGYSVFAAGQNAYDTGYLLAEAVEEYIAAHTPVSPEIEGRIRNVNEESDDEMEAEVDPAKENRVEARERLRINGQDAPRFELDIPSNALPANAAKVRYSKPVTPTNGDLKGSLLYIVLEILDKDGNVIENPTFNPPITLKLRYTDEEASGKEEANFDFAFWNGSKWVAVGPSATCSDCGVQRPVDAENNLVTVKLDHFTEFSLHDGTGLTADEETYPVYLPVVNR